MSAETKTDILVIGAGLIGSAVAAELVAGPGAPTVTVIDRDLEGSYSSSELNAGGVRATFQQAVNITCSKITIEYYEKNRDEVGYRDCGYLWLCGQDRLDQSAHAARLQEELGWRVEILDLAALKRRVPFIDKTSDLAGATFSPKDGLINTNLAKQHFRARAKRGGVKFVDRTEIRDATFSSDEWKIGVREFPRDLSEDEMLSVYGEPSRKEVKPRVLAETVIRANRVINCGGAWAGEIARALGYACPSYAVRRQISLFDCRGVDLSQYGMIVDRSGVYFHPEATYGLAGFANHNEPHGVNFQYGGEEFFNEQIWAHLFERSSAFEQLKHISGWAGQYEVSPDESAIIGPVDNGALGRTVFEAHSFSGHGVMHAYAAGLALAERILKGRYETVDLSQLSGTRFQERRLVREGFVI